MSLLALLAGGRGNDGALSELEMLLLGEGPGRNDSPQIESPLVPYGPETHCPSLVFGFVGPRGSQQQVERVSGRGGVAATSSDDATLPRAGVMRRLTCARAALCSPELPRSGLLPALVSLASTEDQRSSHATSAPTW